jgi:hypothetical protein
MSPLSSREEIVLGDAELNGGMKWVAYIGTRT